MNGVVVSGGAVYQEVIPQTLEQFEYIDIVLLFAAGVGSGILFISMIFFVSLAINAFFDIIKKV